MERFVENPDFLQDIFLEESWKNIDKIDGFIESKANLEEFEVSEEDFKLRGHGDLFGTKQSGDMAFKIANIRQDYKILVQAKKDSLEYLKDENTDNEELKKLLIESINHNS